MKTYSKLTILVWVCLFTFTAPAIAQNNQLYIGVGIATIRGEATAQPVMSEDLGRNYSVKYFIPFKDERWVFTTDFAFAEMNLQHRFTNDFTTVEYQNSLHQSYLGVGFRYYHNQELNKYNPYGGQFLPFVGISFGGISTSRSVTTIDNSPALAFKHPVPDPAGGYEFTPGTTTELNGQLEGGFVMVLNHQWRMEASAQARPGFSDTWDGIVGTGSGKDWFISAGLGMHFQF